MYFALDYSSDVITTVRMIISHLGKSFAHLLWMAHTHLQEGDINQIIGLAILAQQQNYIEDIVVQAFEWNWELHLLAKSG